MKKIKSKYFYTSYLIQLKNRIFKILPLFEEQNDGVYKHIDTLLIELFELEEVFEEFEAKKWYISTLATLKSFRNEEFNSKRIRTNVLRIVNLIDKEIKEERKI